MKSKNLFLLGLAILIGLCLWTSLGQTLRDPLVHESRVTQPRSAQPTGPKESVHKGRNLSPMDQKGIHVVADPASILVLVNKHFKLPENYVPRSLVYPNVPFLSGRTEKAKMRRVAAKALERMFAAAEKDGIHLAGVSAYRSHRSQVMLFERYAAIDGEKKALTYSALPGTSEHETGLAIDVSGLNGKYAATPAFAGTPEAVWLKDHAQDYGYIIRYPKGKEAVTGYEYEAWHLRYVGLPVAKGIKGRHLVLEEYLSTVPVTH